MILIFIAKYQLDFPVFLSVFALLFMPLILWSDCSF